jgi:hypothetical protein
MTSSGEGFGFIGIALLGWKRREYSFKSLRIGGV